MKKQDLIPIVVIFILFLAWGKFGNDVLNKISPPKTPSVAAAVEKAEAPSLPSDVSLAAPASATPAPAGEAAPEMPDAESAVEPAIAEAPRAPEVVTTLANDRVELDVSSHGAGIVRAALIARLDDRYRYPLEKDSELPVSFDFSDRPAAAPVGYPGLREFDDFDVVSATGDSVAYRKNLPNGLTLARTLTLGDGYQVQIEDTIQNGSPAPIALRGYGLQSGTMRMRKVSRMMARP